jgi:hypothetical protein
VVVLPQEASHTTDSNQSSLLRRGFPPKNFSEISSRMKYYTRKFKITSKIWTLRAHFAHARARFARLPCSTEEGLLRSLALQCMQVLALLNTICSSELNGPPSGYPLVLLGLLYLTLPSCH